MRVSSPASTRVGSVVLVVLSPVFGRVRAVSKGIVPITVDSGVRRRGVRNLPVYSREDVSL